MIQRPPPSPTHEFHSFAELMRKLGETFVVSDVMVPAAKIEFVTPGDRNAANHIVEEKRYSVVPASADGQSFEVVFCTEHPVNGARTVTTMRETSVSDHIPDSTPLADAFYLLDTR